MKLAIFFGGFIIAAFGGCSPASSGDQKLLESSQVSIDAAGSQAQIQGLQVNIPPGAVAAPGQLELDHLAANSVAGVDDAFTVNSTVPFVQPITIGITFDSNALGTNPTVVLIDDQGQETEIEPEIQIGADQSQAIIQLDRQRGRIGLRRSPNQGPGGGSSGGSPNSNSGNGSNPPPVQSSDAGPVPGVVTAGNPTTETEPAHQAGGTVAGSQTGGTASTPTAGETEPANQTGGTAAGATGETEPAHQTGVTTPGTTPGATEPEPRDAQPTPAMSTGSTATAAPVACQLGDDCGYVDQLCHRQLGHCALTAAGCLACLTS
jgi:hypothetical protein